VAWLRLLFPEYGGSNKEAMNPNPAGIAAVIIALLVFVAGYWSAVRWRVSLRIFLALAGLVPAMIALKFALHYLHLMPDEAWFFELRSWRGSEFFVVALAGWAAVMASFFPRWLLSVWFVLLAAVICVPFSKPFLAPLKPSSMRDQWSGDACMQSTSSTCGPASVATILKRLGRSVTEREVALAAFSYAGGTEAWYLARFVRSTGLEARFDFREGFKSDVECPALAGVRFGPGGHFIALLERSGDGYVIADPLYGQKVLSVNELTQRYEFSGFYLVVSKNEE